MVGVLTGLGVGVRQQLFWAPLTTGEHTSHTRSHLCTQCSLGQQASEKECIQIIKLFFPYVKNRPATGNVRPGIQACHLAILPWCLFAYHQVLIPWWFSEREKKSYKGTYHCKPLVTMEMEVKQDWCGQVMLGMVDGRREHSTLCRSQWSDPLGFVF